MRQRSCETENARGEALALRIAAVDPAASDAHDRLAALTLGLVDALLVADTMALESALQAVRERVSQLDQPAAEPSAAVVRGWLLALMSATHWSLERLPSSAEITLQQDTLAARFLAALTRRQTYSSRELLALLDTGDTQLSRVGKGLLDHGLVVRRHAGQHAFWEITPRGRQALERASGPTNVATSGGRPRRRRAVGGRSRQRGSTSTSRAAAAALLVDAPARPHTTAREVRVVRPHADGGWCLAMPGSTRAILRFSRKSEAERRGKEILARAGGGLLQIDEPDGLKTKSVEPRPRRKA